MIRDWYTLGQLTLLPMAATLTLHLLILAILILRWQPSSEARTIEARVLPPKAINATLIDADSLKPKKTAKKTPVKKPPAKKPAPKPAPKPVEKMAKAAAEPSPTPTQQSAPAKPSSPTPAPPKPDPEPRRASAEELAALSRQELVDALEAEDSLSVAVTAEEMSASYAALIRDTVSNYWSRPPSARNGMEVLLSIQLVPTGEVVSVNVIRSSGNSAFDNSAVNAVERARLFPELRNLPRREFEQTFRRFQLLFRPEDLRY